MADGTRMKQLELQLQQMIVMVMEMQAQVGSIEEAIRVAVDKKLEDVSDRLWGDMRNQIQEEMQE